MTRFSNASGELWGKPNESAARFLSRGKQSGAEDKRMETRKSTTLQQGDQAVLREHVRLVRMSADFAEQALKNDSGVSRDVWWSWEGHRRTLEDLVALIHHGRTA